MSSSFEFLFRQAKNMKRNSMVQYPVAMEPMPSTQRAKIKGAIQTIVYDAERKRWWVESDDFETAPA